MLGGAKVIERLARDLSDAFPDIRGFSSRNLKYMAFFAQHCPNGLFGQQPAAQLPWFHVVTLLTKLASPEEREWYAQQTPCSAGREACWSRTSKAACNSVRAAQSPTLRHACQLRNRP
jgi:hypothetical protein